ncbi:hypothetical protein BLNAU_1094 [Blattamonas nauphoetae]|uniref:Uncharacterized protein n=1 Tax=Blattamonas nauphoetae TaxID=2049346 RepID=A0ABQ9YJV5_9EUKA|nr:hypothetical protein BLNAU_1094 [Blattamonas nauphoetae]
MKPKEQTISGRLDAITESVRRHQQSVHSQHSIRARIHELESFERGSFNTSFAMQSIAAPSHSIPAFVKKSDNNKQYCNRDLRSCRISSSVRGCLRSLPRTELVSSVSKIGPFLDILSADIRTTCRDCRKRPSRPSHSR